MKKLILAAAVALISFQVAATGDSTCAHKNNADRNDSTNRYDSLLPSKSQTPPKAQNASNNVRAAK